MQHIDTLFRTYYRPLCLYATHYLRDIPTAEDVVGDCFVKLVEHLQQGQRPENIKSYAYMMVRNACLDRLRKSLPFAQDIQPSDLEGVITDDEAQERSLHEALLWTAIDNLPPRQRQCLIMSKREGKTYKAIAEELGISPKTVEHQISNALKALRKQKEHFFYVLMFL